MIEGEGHQIEEEPREELYEVCVVHGHGFRKDKPGSLELDAKIRALAAGALAEDGAVGQLIFTGAIMPSGKSSIASAMRDYMISKYPNLKDFPIKLEEESHDTNENARNVASMLTDSEREKVIVLSSDYHLKRAQESFEQAGISAEIVSAEDLVKDRSSAHHALMDRYLRSIRYKRLRVQDAILKKINRIAPELLSELANKLRRQD